MPRRLGLVALFTCVLVCAAVPGAGAEEDNAPDGEWLVEKVRFEPLDGGTFEVGGVGKYRGNVEIGRGGSGLAVINDVGLEDYVRGVAEVPPGWPAEAQRAQAIAARTYALHQMRGTVTTPWRSAGAQICATQACQVYVGTAAEEREFGANWAAAVESTAGQVLLDGDEPILAEYSSSNGGLSVPGSAWYLDSISDPDDSYSPLHRWTYSIPLAQLAPLFDINPPSTLTGMASDGDTLVLAVRNPDQEVEVERRVGLGDFVAAVNGHGLKPEGLPAAFPTHRFTVSSDGGSAIVEGRGWGHGRGMSQYGAYGKALAGWSASDILAEYYGGIRPVTLAAGELPQTIRVAVSLDRSAVDVAGSGPFRVVDGNGNPIAHMALGRWRVVPEGGGVRVIPPEGFGRPLSLTGSSVNPRRLVAGKRAVVRFGVSAPAVVTVRLRPPRSTATTLTSRVVEAGVTAVTLPHFDAGGDYRVVIEADAGGGRKARSQLNVQVADRAAYGVSSPVENERGPWVWLATVLTLAMATGTAGVYALRRR